MKLNNGFTLVELLITLTIIGLLIGVALPTFTAFNASSRDSKRQSELKTIQSALVQYRADQGFYPATVSFGQALRSPAGGKTYLVKVPTEPLTSAAQYQYTPQPSGCNNSTTLCSGYCLYAALENAGLTDRSSACADLNQYNLELSGI